MVLPDVHVLIRSFDTEQDRALTLDLVRRAAEDVRGLDTPEAREILAYCQVLGSMCDIYLTGPSVTIAEALEEAARLAASVDNHKLALFANWYGACCRLAHVVVRGDRSNSELEYTAKRLVHITDMASIQKMRRLHAVAAATRVECLARMQVRPDDFGAQLDDALELLENVDRSDMRVAERTRLLSRIRDEDFTPSSGGFSQMPTIAETYATLACKPGDLLTTVRSA